MGRLPDSTPLASAPRGAIVTTPPDDVPIRIGRRIEIVWERFNRLAFGAVVVGGVMALIGAGAAFASGRPAAALPVSLAGAVGGFTSATIAYAMLPLLEASRRAESRARLLELASPTHPLLKRLMLDAPGTYSHSLFTGHLVEQAAEAIGADGLLARVGAYYHDVGKLHRPGFFCENQSEEGNPHDESSPKVSAAIIIAHVPDGVALARAYGLPEPVRAIIRQHHGTSLLSFFYDKAARDDSATVEADFRYAGERPTSREAALVMLADAAEAAVRCIRTPTMARVETVVRTVIDQRLADRQLDDATLTTSEIDKVVRVYARMLVGMSHPRIEYREPGATSAAPDPAGR